MTIRVQVQISDDLRALMRRLNALDLDDAVHYTALEARAFVTKGFGDTPKTGRLYRRGRRTHTASSPGNFPAIDTGDLKRSTRTLRTGKARFKVVFGKAYAVYLEYGTIRMSARPFVRETLEYAEKRLQQRTEAALRAAGLD